MASDRLEYLADRTFADDASNPLRETHALVVAQNGEIVLERYADGFDESSTFISWSMAKSMLSALVGVLVGRGLLALDEPAPVVEWMRDQRAAITLRHLLQMRSGLSWNEDYVDADVSDVIEMLFGEGQHDTAAHAIARPLDSAPGTVFNYSSGTSNIVSRIATEAIGGGAEGLERELIEELLRPAGMTNPTLTFDDAGTWIGSSFLYATARDFLAFGELFRNDGVADGRRLLPEGWVEESIVEHAVDEESGQGYGLHWWLVRDEPASFAANGYEGQRIQVTPELGLTFVRLGKTDAAHKADLASFYADIVDCF